MSDRVAIVHHGYVPRYRMRFYEKLATCSEVEYVVFHSDPPRNAIDIASPGPYPFPNRHVPSRTIPVGGRRLVQQSLVREIAWGYDAAVLGANMRFVSSHAVRALMTLRRRPVVYWGHADHSKVEFGDMAAPLARVRDRARHALVASADGYLAYTAGGAARLVADGLDSRRVHVLRNTLDMEMLQTLRDRAAAETNHALPVDRDAALFVYIGRVYPEKCVDDLAAVARRLRTSGTRAEFVVIGGGPDLERARSSAAGAPGVRFLGPVPDELEVARWMKRATAVVIPGAVGLAVNHAFAHGVPLVTRASRLHSPELEYLEHGRNGLIVPGDLDELSAALRELAESPGLRRGLAAGARASGERLDLETMVAAFDGGVRRALAGRRSGGHASDRAPSRARPRSSRFTEVSSNGTSSSAEAVRARS